MVLIGAAISAAVFFYVPDVPVQNTPAPAIETSALPMRLRISAIDLDASIENVGLTDEGAMDVPKNRANVAWFEPGWRPGENGNAVMAGHYGIRNGRPSVFDDLHKLRRGDVVSVEDDKGSIISFVVREIRRYDPEADASSVFVSYDGKSRLVLITCEGEWDALSDGYPRRLVVFADKE